MSPGGSTATALGLAYMLLVSKGQWTEDLKCCYFAFEVTLYYGPRARLSQKVICGLAQTGRAVSC